MKPVVGAGNKLEINLTHQEIRFPGGRQHPAFMMDVWIGVGASCIDIILK